MERLLFITVALAAVISTGAEKVGYTVRCSHDSMTIIVDKSEDVKKVSLDKWGDLPGCQSKEDEKHFIIPLKLDDDLSCGTTRVRNKLTEELLFYHRVAVTTSKGRQVILVKCHVHPGNRTLSNIVKRDTLPAEFVEPDYIEITSEVTGHAPEPILGVAVRQNGNLVGDELNVVPGTPLMMEVYLDDTSGEIYGILVNYMEVTDTGEKRETIVYNGCSVDPYLFENFDTRDGDYLNAKFRAFKFPETNYVLFRGTVDVCLDKCNGIECSNGRIGFGRKRRDVSPNRPADPNKIYEVTMKTFLKFNETIEREYPSVSNKGEVFSSRSASPRRVVVREEIEEELVVRQAPEEPAFIYFAGNGVVSISSSLCTMFLMLLALQCYL